MAVGENDSKKNPVLQSHITTPLESSVIAKALRGHPLIVALCQRHRQMEKKGR